MTKRQGPAPVSFFGLGRLPHIFYLAAMEEKKASFHEKVVTLVIAAIIAGLFIKTLFF